MFEAPSLAFRDADSNGFLMAPIISGEHIFVLERDGNFVNFYHSSPGTGTRFTSVDFGLVPQSNLIRLAITWAPAEIVFHLGTAEPVNYRVSASGQASKKQFRVTSEGELIQIGSKDFDGIRLKIMGGEPPILLPTAIESWRDTRQAILVLLAGTSKEVDLFEIVVSNMALVLLISGLESYTKYRMNEMESEGILPDTQAIIDKFLTGKKKSKESIEQLKQKAVENNNTILKEIITRKYINFQNFHDCRIAYKKAFGVMFDNIGLQQSEIEQLKKIFDYRISIIHVSATSGILNHSEVPPEEPVFSNIELARASLDLMSKFIDKLHDATLKIK